MLRGCSLRKQLRRVLTQLACCRPLAGYANCGTTSPDCETNVKSDPSHCGDCTTVCQSPKTCQEGKCLCPKGGRAFACLHGSCATAQHLHSHVCRHSRVLQTCPAFFFCPGQYECNGACIPTEACCGDPTLRACPVGNPDCKCTDTAGSTCSSNDGRCICSSAGGWHALACGLLPMCRQ